MEMEICCHIVFHASIHLMLVIFYCQHVKTTSRIKILPYSYYIKDGQDDMVNNIRVLLKREIPTYINHLQHYLLLYLLTLLSLLPIL